MLKRVYVFEYDGNFKIGVSGNTKRRKMDLSVGCPGIESLYESDYLSNAFHVEHLLHRLFSEYSIGGEWFSSIDLETVKKVIDAHGSLEEKIPEKKEIPETTEIKEIIINQIPKTIEKSEFLGKFKVYIRDENGELKTPDDIKKESEKVKEENIQIEKFTEAVKGFDIPNIYSDLIYEVLFGTDTQGMIEKYKPEKFESFRKKLTNEQNKEIDNLTSLIGGLINYYWDFSRIEEFVKTKIHPKSASVQKND